jgi:hypothetical protein
MPIVPTMKVKHVSLPLLEYVIIDRADFDPEIHTPYETDVLEKSADSLEKSADSLEKSADSLEISADSPEISADSPEVVPTKKRRNTPAEG